MNILFSFYNKSCNVDVFKKDSKQGCYRSGRYSFKTIIKDNDKSALYLLGAIFFWFLGYNALEVFFTSFAVNVLGVDSGEATFLLAYFSLAIIITAPIAGYVGGKVGRKRTMIV